jgi:FMN phosphatase YigB (HAD superfamily)
MGDVLFSWDPKAGIQVSVQTLRLMTQCELWFEFERGNIDAEECYRELGKKFSVCPSKIAGTFLRTTGSLLPNEEMTALVRDIKLQTNISVYMMTNIPRPDFDQLRAQRYIWDLFDGVFASGYQGMRKPELRFYLHVLSVIGVEPADVVFVDDKIENVVSARELGIEAIQCIDIRGTCSKLRQMIGLMTTS